MGAPGNSGPPTLAASDPDLVVVGAGPVGLLAGILAHDAGLRVLVLDREPETCTHSRAIGIHPPALRIFDRVPFRGGREADPPTLADVLVAAGVRVCRGHGFSGPDRPLGTLEFERLDPPWNYILMLPQWRTESLLQEALLARGSELLRRGVTVTGVTLRSSGSPPLVRVAAESMDATGERIPHTFRARFVLACDGKRSTVREALGIDFPGGPYPHRYYMGDFAIRGQEPRLPVPAHDAAIFVAKGGLVESFPLEEGVRRWVVQRRPGDPPPSSGRDDPETVDARRIRELVELVGARTGIDLDPEGCSMISAFGVERFMAARFWMDGVVLLGDAAHIVSPIGGQGMNLGWIHARKAVDAVTAVIRGEIPEVRAAREFEEDVRRRTRQVRRRAEQNMRLGHRPPRGSALLQSLRAAIVRILLHSPLRRFIARRFTMHGL